VVFLDLENTDGLASIGPFIYRDDKVGGILWNKDGRNGAHLASMAVRHIKPGLDRQPMTQTEIFPLLSSGHQIHL